MKTKAQVKKFCEANKIDFSYSESREFWDIDCYAPEGKVFNATGGQVVTTCWARGGYDKGEFWQKVYDDIETIEEAPEGFVSEIYEEPTQ